MGIRYFQYCILHGSDTSFGNTTVYKLIIFHQYIISCHSFICDPAGTCCGVTHLSISHLTSFMHMWSFPLNNEITEQCRFLPENIDIKSASCHTLLSLYNAPCPALREPWIIIHRFLKIEKQTKSQYRTCTYQCKTL